MVVPVSADTDYRWSEMKRRQPDAALLSDIYRNRPSESQTSSATISSYSRAALGVNFDHAPLLTKIAKMLRDLSCVGRCAE
jgi:hypothetical protein